MVYWVDYTKFSHSQQWQHPTACVQNTFCFVLSFAFPQVALGRQHCPSKQAFSFNLYQQGCSTTFLGKPPVMISLKDALPMKTSPDPVPCSPGDVSKYSTSMHTPYPGIFRLGAASSTKQLWCGAIVRAWTSSDLKLPSTCVCNICYAELKLFFPSLWETFFCGGKALDAVVLLSRVWNH